MEAPRDQNRVPTLLGVSVLDFLTPTTVAVNPVTRAMLVEAPTGGGTASNVTVSNAFLLDNTFTTRINTLGQKTMANSTPVVLASDQAAIPVTLTSTSISSVTAGTGATNLGAAVDAARGATKTGVLALVVRDDVLTTQTPVNDDYVEFRNDAYGALWVRESHAQTTTLANVASATTTGTLLAANTNRKGAYIFNDSTSALYVKFGATASTTSFTVKIAAGGYYEFPVPMYQGVVDGIWDTANGAARVTEVT